MITILTKSGNKIDIVLCKQQYESKESLIERYNLLLPSLLRDTISLFDNDLPAKTLYVNDSYVDYVFIPLSEISVLFNKVKLF